MGRRRGGLAALVLWALLCLGAAAPALNDDPAGDMKAVYCLSRPHRAELIDAAVVLKAGARDTATGAEALKTRDKVYATPELWREGDSAAFDRVCSALVATVPQLTAPGGSSPLADMAAVVLPLLLGAALTIAGQRADAALARRAQDRDEARGAAARFQRAARDYVDAWVDDETAPSAQASEAALDLLAAVARLGGGGARRTAAARVTAALPVPYDLNVIHDGEPGHERRRTLGAGELARLAGIVHATEVLIRTRAFPLIRAADPAPPGGGAAGGPATAPGTGGGAA
ncbi:hypothetical protein Skr01_03880 [Sphaerisporangium krabiense]|uniref:Uncharacterized protein n=1 Tax=Sphaerisporangium krabiense TaxID=763782 RepID=A0A7W8Z7K9_9ACTN|nr:hypothetical protein [Sphaerisporangium krabiense]MBB5628856.1 hypothetical protein [Sphaerisporangium krabiense]GII60303.1 hypothetical protein Skr01_03880 [Sphaerisporangium krabiense]